jgi:hypothetical protein
VHCHRVARARVVDAVSGSKYLHLDVSTHIFRSLSPSLVRNTTFNSDQRHYSSQIAPLFKSEPLRNPAESRAGPGPRS